MTKKTRVLQGSVLDGQQRPVAGAVVQVGFEQDGQFHVVEGTATDASGAYQVDALQAQRLAGGKRLEVRVVRDDDAAQVVEVVRGLDTSDAAYFAPVTADITPKDPRAPRLIEPVQDNVAHDRSIRGTVHRARGANIDQLAIRLLHYLNEEGRILAAAEQVAGGATTTDASGAFVLGWTMAAPSPPLPGASGDVLVIEVLDDDVLIARTPLLDKLPDHARIRIYVQRASVASRYDALDAVADNLETDAIAPPGPDALALLHRRTGGELVEIGRVLAADVLASSLDLATLDPADRAPALFALLAHGLSATPERLVRAPSATVLDAIDAAIDAGTIHHASPETFRDDVVAALVDARRADASHVDARYSVVRLLEVARESTALSAAKDDILAAAEAHPTDPSAFWAALDTLPSTARDDLNLTLALGAVTFNRPACVAALLDFTFADTTTIDAPWKVAWLTDDDWSDVLDEVDEQDEDFSGVPGETFQQRKDAFRDAAQAFVERAFPSPHLIGRFLHEEGGEEPPDPMVAFLQAHPTFDLEHAIVPDAFGEGQEAHDGAIPRLRRVQRLLHVAPKSRKYEVVTALEAEGITSALDIVRRGRAAFVDLVADQLPGDDAQAKAAVAHVIFARSKQKVAGTQQVLARVHGAMAPAPVHMVPSMFDRQAAEEVFPGSSALFGPASACGCSWCRSVHGPAAYLADVLGWLRDQGAVQSLSGDPPYTLNGRRADVCALDLTCANVEIEVPYIDLVNELLEHAADDSTPLPTASTGTSAERALTPQFHNPDVYATSGGDTVGTAIYPNTLPFDRVSCVLRAHLDPLRSPRVELMERLRTEGTPSVDAWAAEALGLGMKAFLLIDDGDIPTDPGERYGFPDPAVPGGEPLDQVDVFLRRSGLQHAELVALLQTRYAGRVDATSRHYVITGDPCDLSAQTIADVEPVEPAVPDPAAFTRMDRFIRLWRATRWPMRVLDTAVALAAGGSLDGLTARIATVLRIADATGLPPAGVAAWGRFLPDTHLAGDPSLATSPYDDTFLDPALPGDAGAFALNEARDALLGESPEPDDLADHATRIRAALRLSAADYEALATYLGESPPLTLVQLGRLWRGASLARAARLPVPDLLRVLDALVAEELATHPLDVSDWMDQAMPVLDQVSRIRSARMTIDELLYLSIHDATSAARVAPSDATLHRHLLDLASQLSTIDDDAATAALRRLVAEIFGLPVAQVEALWEVDFFNVVSEAPGTGNGTIEVVFGAPGFAPDADAPDPRTESPEAFRLAEILLKTRRLVRALGVDSDELQAWVDAPPGAGLPAIASMSCSDAQADPPPFMSLIAVLDADVLVRERDRFGGAGSLAEVISLLGGADAPLVSALSAATGRAEGAFAPWIARFGPTAAGVARSLEADRRARSLDVTAETLIDWAGDAPSRIDEAIGALRARFPDRAAWRVAARSAMNTVREAQRDALVAFHVGRRTASAATPDDLSEHLLVDVQTSACATTSRLRLAMSSVQTFVQRCLLGQEDELTLGADAPRTWEWMKTYRVWEAARKVFLWPENWFDPALRSDKTAAFHALEDGLHQQRLDERTVDEAFVAYLEQLHEVAHLEPIGLAFEGDEETSTIHLVGRTRASPHRAYYRTRDRLGVWTSWERIEVEIPATNVVVCNLRDEPTLFWLSFEEVAETVWSEGAELKGAGMLTRGDATNYIQHRIRIHHTSRRHRQWAPPSTWTGVVDTRGRAATRDALPEGYRLVSTDETNGTTLRLMRGRHVVGEFAFDEASRDIRWTPAPTDEDEDSANANPYRPERTIAWHQGWRAQGRMTLGVLPTTPPVGAVDASDAQILLARRGRLDTVLWPASELAHTAAAPFTAASGREAYLFVRATGPAPLKEIVAEPLVGWIGAHQTLFGLTPPASSAVPPQATIDNRSLDHIDGIFTTGAPTTSLAAWSQTIGASTKPSLGGYTAPAEDVHVAACALHHPYAESFLRTAQRDGAMALLAPGDGSAFDLQGDVHDAFSSYAPTPSVVSPRPVSRIDFTLREPFGAYNWEVFFHAPLRIANALALHGQFDAALRWLHTIFDPRRWRPDDPDAVWRTRPLRDDTTRTLDDLIAATGLVTGDPPESFAERDERAAEFDALVATWRDNPFDPGLIARSRPGSFQRAVVRRYVETLIAWGDQLFRQFTMETVNEATQLYLLAKRILGERPATLAEIAAPQATSFNDLAVDLDGFGNALVMGEHLLVGWEPGSGDDLGEDTGPPWPATMAFCAPPNERMVGLWDTVDDRLFKVRNCRTLDGDARALPLFEPPIDPALLIRAAQAGLGLSTVVGMTGSTLSNHRFAVVHQRAMALASSAQRLGSGLLSALEKRDAEALVLLRSRHEVELLHAVRAIKVTQIDEARAQRDAARAAHRAAEQRKEHYAGLLAAGLSENEELQLERLRDARIAQGIAEGMAAVAGAVRPIPELKTGVVGVVPTLEATVGGAAIAGALQLGAEVARSVSSQFSHQAVMRGYDATYARRVEEWTYQHGQATIDVTGHERQVAAAEARLTLAEQDLANHDRLIGHAGETLTFLESKFSSEQLYDWMVTRLASTYRQTFQLAFDMARAAERCLEHEVAIDPAQVQFVRADGWDDLRHGLLAAERLQADLERMEAAFLQQDVRELELTKQVSLDLLDPMALVKLRETGACSFHVPEAWFDLDYPGHYFRRLQAVQVSIPAVSGPIAGVTAELELVDNALRYKDSTTDYAAQEAEEVRSVTDGANTVIATSTGLEDGGVFSLDWRDPKYLPFERHGVIGTWALRLTGSVELGGRPSFDWQSIADVVLTLRYTARRAPALKEPAADALNETLNAYESLTDQALGLHRVVRAARDFPDAWHTFLHPGAEAEETALVLPIPLTTFPHPFQDEDTVITQVEVLLRGGGASPSLTLAVEVGETTIDTEATIAADHKLGLAGWSSGALSPALAPDTLTLTADVEALEALVDAVGDPMTDLLVSIRYRVGPAT